MGFAEYFRFVGALAAVLALIGAAAWAARRLGLAAAAPRRGARRRLSLVEVLPLDAKRRLVLVRRDGVEHLVLLGLQGDLLLESAIPAPAEFGQELDAKMEKDA